MYYCNIFSVLVLVGISQCQSSFPIRIPPVLVDKINGSNTCSGQSIESTEKIFNTIFDRIFSQENCNCSQLIDSTRNVSCIRHCCGDGRLIFDADLTKGSFFLAPESGITWLTSTYDPASSRICDIQRVLRINFQEACNFTQNCKLRFDFNFDEDFTGWNFNIGDSSNDGNGGDAGHTSNAAEVHNINRQLRVLTNTLPGFTSITRNGNLIHDHVNDVVGGNFTLVIGDEFVMFDNHNGVQKSYRSRYFFTLNGQPTTYGPVDYLINFGMNRVINHNRRSGTGLCRATIKMLSC